MKTFVRRAWQGIPRLMQVGLTLAVLGGVIDVAYHLVTHSSGMGHGPIAFTGHVVTLVGMVVTMAGLIGAALVRRPASPNSSTKGERR